MLTKPKPTERRPGTPIARMIVTCRPVHPKHVELAAEALWNQHREIEGRVPWDEAAEFAREPFEKKAQLVLETVLPLERDVLEGWLVAIHEAIDLI